MFWPCRCTCLAARVAVSPQIGECVGLLMSPGFLHSNGNVAPKPQACSSDRSLGSTRPQSSFGRSTARYQSLAPSHCPAAAQAPLPPPSCSVQVDRQFDEIHQQAATHPRAHQFRNTSNLFHGLLAASSDHHQWFLPHRLCFSTEKTRPPEATVEERRTLETGPWPALAQIGSRLIPAAVDVVLPVLLLPSFIYLPTSTAQPSPGPVLGL